MSDRAILITVLIAVLPVAAVSYFSLVRRVYRWWARREAMRRRAQKIEQIRREWEERRNRNKRSTA